jgi:hypothetical protein
MEANSIEMSERRHNQNVRKHLESSSSCMIRIVGVRNK